MLSTKRTRFAGIAAVSNLGQFVHSILLQFTQLYEYLAIDSGGHLCTKVFMHYLLHGMMLPGEVAMVFG